MDAINDFYCLKIILQPIVENAFLHGMDDLDRKMYIRLKAKVYDDRIEIKITDTGGGMSRERLKQVRSAIRSGAKIPDVNTLKRHKSTGIGMSNVDERLKNYFGRDFGIDIYSKLGIGTMVVLRIPKLITPPGKKDA